MRDETGRAALSAAEMILSRLVDVAGLVEISATAARATGMRVWHDDASLLAGMAGNALAFASAARALPHQRDSWLSHAASALRHAAQTTRAAPVTTTGMGSGTAGLAFAVSECAALDERYRPAVLSLNARLRAQTEGIPEEPRTPLTFGHYDALVGAAGTLGYATSAPGADDDLRHTAAALVRRLVGIAGRTGDLRSWCIPPESYPPKDPAHDRYRHGYADLGMAHGLPGPLAALTRAWAAGFHHDDVRTTVRALTTQLIEASGADGWGRGWPRVLPFDDAGRPDPGDVELTGPAYCYGPPGICSALFDAGEMLGDDTVRDVAVQGFEAALRRIRATDRMPTSSSLCHGVAGLVLLCHKFATRAGSADAVDAAGAFTEALLSRCDASLPLGVREYVPSRAGEPGTALAARPDGMWIDHPGFLEGAAGVALALLAVVTPTPVHWSRALLAD